jgi:threonine/homoserine/homoserine lactone efflux protein
VTFPFDGRFLAWLAVAIVLIITPGPDTALIIRNALGAGARSASLSAIGVGAGSAVWAAASVVGLAALLETSDVAFTVFKLAGAAYLVYLGLRTLAGTFRPAPDAVRDLQAAAPAGMSAWTALSRAC